MQKCAPGKWHIAQLRQHSKAGQPRWYAPPTPHAAATHLLLPPASRKEPSAEKAREVKQRPLLVLAEVRRSARRRPPAMSLRPAMVPCM